MLFKNTNTLKRWSIISISIFVILISFWLNKNIEVQDTKNIDIDVEGNMPLETLLDIKVLSEHPNDIGADEIIIYQSLTAQIDCRFCGYVDNETPMDISSYWGRKNVGILNLHTFEFLELKLNRYDENGNIDTSKVGYGNLFILPQSEETESSTYFGHIMYDDGFSVGQLTLQGDSILDVDKLSKFLCTECLTSFMNKVFKGDEIFDFALLDLATKELHPLSKSLTGFELGDFYIDSCYHDSDINSEDKSTFKMFIITT